MAQENDFSFRIGIDDSDFDKGLKETQNRLRAAMAQFEREKSLIKIRADIDIAGLDETADKAKILDIQEKALTDTLDIQRQKLQAAAEAYELVAESQGVQAAASKKIELSMEKERLKVVQLEKDLEKLKQSSATIDTTVKVNVDDSEIDNIKIDAPKVDIKAEVDTSQVEKSVSKAESAIKASVDKLSRQQALIQLRGQVQLEGLDESAGSAEKLKLQEEALTAQIELQREKIALLSSAHEDLVRKQGENSDAAQVAAINLEKEQLAMARLKQQTQDLSKQTEIAFGVEWEMLGLIEPAIKGIDALIAAGRTIPIPHAKAAAAVGIALTAIIAGSKEATDELRENNPAQILSDSFEGVETDISESFAEITKGATQTSREIGNVLGESTENVSSDLETMGASYTDFFDDALSIIQILVSDTENLGDSLSVVNSQLPYMRTETGRIAAIAVGLYKTFDELTKQAIEFAQPAVDGYKEVKKQADELYLSLSKAQEIGSLIDLAGGDYDDIRDLIRGAQDAVIKGAADDPEVLGFAEFGVTIQDAKGNLLEFDEALENVYQGYLKAKEAGQAEAYLMMINGESVHDAATFMENYGKAKERAAQIKWSTSDFASLDELATNLKIAEVQTNEFQNALSTLGAPLANLAAESNFEFFKTMTELIEENRDTILLWEFAAIEAFKSGKDTIIEFADSATEKLQELNETFGITDKLQSLISVFGESLGLTEEFEKASTASGSAKEDSIFSRAKKDLEEYNAANKKSREEAKKNRKDVEGLSYSLNRIAKYKEEIANIKIELQFGDDNYKKSLAQLEQWRETALKDARQYEGEQAVIAEEYALKREQIEQQHQEELKKIREESLERAQDFMRETASIEFENTHSEFEKQLLDIENWKQAQLEKAETAEEVSATIANAAMKEADAFEKEVDRIRGKIESAQDRLARLTLSQRDNDIYQAQKQYYQDLKELPKEFADAIYKAQIASINKRTKEDKSGSYRKRPDGAPNDDTYYQLLDFTNANKHINNAAENLVKLDAEEMARAELLKKSALGIAEVERSANRTSRATTELANANLALANTNLKAETASEQAAEKLQDTADTASNFGGTLQNANSAIDKNISALKNATSATGTFIRGLANVADIEARKNQENFSLPDLKPTQEPQGERIKIMYGNRDDDDFESNDDIPVLYGKFADLGNATEDLSADIQNVRTDYLEQLNTSAEKTSASLAKVDSTNVQQAATKAADSTERLGDKFPPLATALDSVTNSLQQAAEKIAKIEFKAPSVQQTLQQPALQDNNNDMINKSLDATQTSGKIMNWMGTLMTAAPLFMLGGPPGAAEAIAMQGVRLALLGGGIEIGADVAQQAYNINKDTANLSAPIPQDIPTFEAFNLGLDKSVTSLDTFSKALSDSVSKFEGIDIAHKDIIDIAPITQDLATLTQNVGAIAADLKAIQEKETPAPVITVNVDAPINLGGAYVFDDAMKIALTEDIKNEIANGVTDAVQKANSQGLFGFNN